MLPAGWFTSNEPREVSEVELLPARSTIHIDKKRILNFYGRSAIPPDVCYLSTAHRNISTSSTVNSQPSCSSQEDSAAGVIFAVLAIILVCYDDTVLAVVTSEIREPEDIATEKSRGTQGTEVRWSNVL